MPTQRSPTPLRKLGLLALLSSAMILTSDWRGSPAVSGQASGPPPVEPSLTAARDSTWWNELLIAGQPAGYGVIRRQRIAQQQQRWTQTAHIETQRNGQPIQQRVSWNCVQDHGGALVRFTLSVSDNQSERSYQGVRNGDTLIVTTLATQGANNDASVIRNDSHQESTETLTIPASCGGFAAVEQSLLAAPLRFGETRELTMLLPVINQVATIQLLAKENSTVELPDGTCFPNALRIEQVTELQNGRRLQAELWTDPQGHVVQSKVAALKQLVARTTQARAQQTRSGPAPDICQLTQWTVVGASSDTHSAATATYLWEGLPATTANDRVQQTARPVSGGTEIRVQSTLGLSWTNRASDRAQQQPTTMRTASIPGEIRAAAEQATHGLTTPWAIAKQLERFVFDHIECKDYSRTFSTALETLRSQTGDCTEHALLLAELCRARQIPTRIVLGLAHVEQSAFQIHLWNEVLVRGQWRPLDATLALGGIPATHIALDQSESSYPQTLLFTPATWQITQPRITLLKKNQATGHSAEILANRVD